MAAEHPLESHEPTIENASAPLSEHGREMDLNAYDTYDYAQAEFDASTGLPPPEDVEECDRIGCL
jgi:hypothetical protein